MWKTGGNFRKQFYANLKSVQIIFRKVQVNFEKILLKIFCKLFKIFEWTLENFWINFEKNFEQSVWILGII